MSGGSFIVVPLHKVCSSHTVRSATGMACKKIMNLKGESSLSHLLGMIGHKFHFMRRIRAVIRKISKFPGGVIIGVALSAIPVIIAIVQDRGIGRNTFLEIGNIVGSYCGDVADTVLCTSLGGAAIQFVLKVGTLVGLTVSKIFAGALIGMGFAGVGAIIGAAVGGLIALGAHAVIFKAYRKAIKQSKRRQQKYKLCWQGHSPSKHLHPKYTTACSLEKRKFDGPPICKGAIDKKQTCSDPRQLVKPARINPSPRKVQFDGPPIRKQDIDKQQRFGGPKKLLRSADTHVPPNKLQFDGPPIRKQDIDKQQRFGGPKKLLRSADTHVPPNKLQFDGPLLSKKDMERCKQRGVLRSKTFGK